MASKKAKRQFLFIILAAFLILGIMAIIIKMDIDNNTKWASAGAIAAIRLHNNQEVSGEDYKVFVFAYRHASQRPILKKFLREQGISEAEIERLGTGKGVTVYANKE